LLHFPSANTAAHRPSGRDVARLGELLDDDVWAFSNCRVDAPGKPVAEVDWFFYNVRTGTIMISEWKGFPRRVVSAADTGSPWLLEGGLSVPNPVEQVSRQLDSVRAVLRAAILPKYFPDFDALQLLLMTSVYSPQVDDHTTIERIRWGKVYGTLPGLAAVIANTGNRVPLQLPDAGARPGLAAELCALFRTEFPSGVKARLRASTKAAANDAVQRISEIHRQIAALHAELAELVVAAARQAQPQSQPAPPSTARPVAATMPAVSDYQRMHGHLAKSFKGVNGNREDAAKALGKAWKLVLGDPLLHGKDGISVSLFGAAGAPLVKEHHRSIANVLGMQLREWCVLQAKAAGMQPRDVPGKPSNLRVR